MQFEIKKIVRPSIEKLKPYSSAKDEYTGMAKVLLDANENSLGSPLTKWYNRYPDPYQKEIKEKLSSIKNIPTSKIFLGNGSDEIIDLFDSTNITLGELSAITGRSVADLKNLLLGE